MRAGLARVHADQDARRSVIAPQRGREGAPRGVKSRVIEGMRSGDTTDSIGTKELFGHAARVECRPGIAKSHAQGSLAQAWKVSRQSRAGICYGGKRARRAIQHTCRSLRGALPARAECVTLMREEAA
jgi:hypothetical protein